MLQTGSSSLLRGDSVQPRRGAHRSVTEFEDDIRERISEFPLAPATPVPGTGLPLQARRLRAHVTGTETGHG